MRTISALAVIAIAVVLVLPNESRPDHARRRAQLASAEHEVTTLLIKMRGAWEPRTAERLMAQARKRVVRLAGPLQRILRLPEHPLLEPAIVCAGALGAAELLDPLRRLSQQGKPVLRAKALRAAEALAPWSVDELAEFLGTEQPAAVQIAALQVVAGRDAAPWDEALALLRSPGAEVRQAVIQAVPRDPPPAVTRALLDLVAFGNPIEIHAALAALARTRMSADGYEVALRTLRQTTDDVVRINVLACLAAQRTALPDTEPVRALAHSWNHDPRVRSAALYCLEQTGDLSQSTTPGSASALEPAERYFAARCLVQAGAVEGFQMLLELATLHGSEYAIASRQALSALTGLGPSAPVEVFRAALASSPATAVALPRAQLDLMFDDVELELARPPAAQAPAPR